MSYLQINKDFAVVEDVSKDDAIYLATFGPFGDMDFISADLSKKPEKLKEYLSVLNNEKDMGVSVNQALVREDAPDVVRPTETTENRIYDAKFQGQFFAVGAGRPTDFNTWFPSEKRGSKGWEIIADNSGLYLDRMHANALAVFNTPENGKYYSAIKQLREDANMSIDELARKAMITRPRLVSIENREDVLAPTELKVLANIFNVSAAALEKGRIEKVSSEGLTALIREANEKSNSLKVSIKELRDDLREYEKHISLLNDIVDRLRKDYLEDEPIESQTEIEEFKEFRDELVDSPEPIVTILESAVNDFKPGDRLTLFTFEKELHKAWDKDADLYKAYVRYNIDTKGNFREEGLNKRIYPIGLKPDEPIIYKNLLDDYKISSSFDIATDNTRNANEMNAYIGKHLSLSYFNEALQRLKEGAAFMPPYEQEFISGCEDYISKCRQCLNNKEQLPQLLEIHSFNPSLLENKSLTGEYALIGSEPFLVTNLSEDRLKSLGYDFHGSSEDRAYNIYEHKESSRAYAVRSFQLERIGISLSFIHYSFEKMEREKDIVKIHLGSQTFAFKQIQGDHTGGYLEYDLKNNQLTDNVFVTLEHRGGLFNALNHGDEVIYTKEFVATYPDEQTKQFFLDEINKFTYEGKNINDFRNEYIKEQTPDNFLSRLEVNNLLTP